MTIITFMSFASERTSFSPDAKGLISLTFPLRENQTPDIIDKGSRLGDIRICCSDGTYDYDLLTSEHNAEYIDHSKGTDQKVCFKWNFINGLILEQSFETISEALIWKIRIKNTSTEQMTINGLGAHIPIGNINYDIPARYNYNRHESICGHASWIYWSRFDGMGDCLVFMPQGRTSLEFCDRDDWVYIHSLKLVDRVNDTWHLPSSECILEPSSSCEYSFKIFTVTGKEDLEQAILDNGGINFRVTPGMVIPRGREVRFALRSKENLLSAIPQYPGATKVSTFKDANEGFKVVSITFDKLGENNVAIEYGNGKKMFLTFFITEEIETLIKKRAKFIVTKQQTRDSEKWYDGLYSLYDMKEGEAYTPEYYGCLSEFMVGGSDDPSNSKPVFISEKNVLYPSKEEIESLEYYEKNFVWGKLQRTSEEEPFPYGIYGSDNWFKNRSGKFGGYDSGGEGLSRMWRTFDYVTHIAIYFNLYRIASDNPSMVTYLDADGYLDRAYHTAMAYFEIPYNIYMGKQWAFSGWCDWAYKQGNFHERYILHLIDALEEEGKWEEADRLRCEWEKKVAYMIYEDPWPFGSEMFIDRTAYESSYYIAEYALKHEMVPKDSLWFDKNLRKWYGYSDYPVAFRKRFMDNQLAANLTIRGIHESSYFKCGTAMTGYEKTLEYMTQMGGVALLDYGTRFSHNQPDIIRYGYNSILASWALVNSGDRASDFGYWYPGKQNDGAASWEFQVYQNEHPNIWRSYKHYGRGGWRYDGEIDHGFTGGVHGAGCYLISDPIFGDIAYGGELRENRKYWKISIWDGAGRYIAIPQQNRFEMKLGNNGIKDDTETSISKDLREISFVLERRVESRNQKIEFRNLPYGKYSIYVGNKKTGEFTSDSEVTKIGFPIHRKNTQITIMLSRP